ncbi:hypothetical protein SDC9_87414 [bioreactor metagenome]|uniref:Uncharacterized protein n=2 Tax=root TaxID=1 RepID=A0A562JKM2_9FIRM|nr:MULTISPECIES: hypothetical protein [Sedimentibacter]MEA5096512.1 hypothetical protein [Sedimentibacter saalensis]TWH83766.1 hypothetical protein LY60_00378 [Sedimentibacter saalensis]
MSRLLGVFMFPIFIIVPAIVLYFVIKLAIKHAIKELKDNNIL